MDKKPTDNEIIKALECCTTNGASCKDCPAFVKVDRSNCKKYFRGAFDLINRQKADLIDKEKQLQEALKSMAVNKTKVIDSEKEINRLNAEIERLKPFEDKIAEFNSHIRVEDMLVFASSLEEWLEFCENLKAEAYKECVEKVKSEIDSQSHSRSLEASGERFRIHKILDNLLKELVNKEN